MFRWEQKSPMLRRLDREIFRARLLDLVVDTVALVLLIAGLFVAWSVWASWSSN